jgi:hypothetical protein
VWLWIFINHTHIVASPSQIFINRKHIGGCEDLYRLEATGELDKLLATLKTRRMSDPSQPRSAGLTTLRWADCVASQSLICTAVDGIPLLLLLLLLMMMMMMICVTCIAVDATCPTLALPL